MTWTQGAPVAERTAVAADPEGAGGRLRRLAEDGAPLGKQAAPGRTGVGQTAGRICRGTVLGWPGRLHSRG